jgi:hypothetical protein
MQARLDRRATLPIERRVQAEVASLTALTDAPLSVVEDGLFQRILNSLVEIGRENAQFHFGPGGCTLSRYRTRKALIEEADILSHIILVDHAKKPCVSLVIDAGTIERQYFLDLMILVPYRGLRRFLSDSLENERLTADDYGKIVAQAIEELKTQSVRVHSIVGDNLPAQIPTVAHWSPKSRLGSPNTFLEWNQIFALSLSFHAINCWRLHFPRSRSSGI